MCILCEYISYIYIYTTSFIEHRTAVLSLYCFTVDTGIFRTLTLRFGILSHDSWRSPVRIRNMGKVKKSGQMAPGLPAVDLKQSADGIQAIKLPIFFDGICRNYPPEMDNQLKVGNFNTYIYIYHCMYNVAHR